MEVVEGFLNTPIHRHRLISVEDVEATLDTPMYTHMDSDQCFMHENFFRM